ncbi:hypothetical protein [Mesorhizobium sp. CO1-1-4]|uniref:hypothetical protein n=1 Tax=Mesorhizobium sp. CO1-1-4 TaxID=2876633 RepID=UPI001CCFC7D6|nr:hypothetical protein [Mesorhizobium sp. CO1-1-4]MBZ9740639.1 hypothetical protein [Mesorhizobium sp. CO1-1-4]
MPESSSLNYILMWNKQPGLQTETANISGFDSGPNISFQVVNTLQNIVEGSKLWIVDASRAVTINTVQQNRIAGQLTDESLFICGFFVIKGNVEYAIQRHGEIDFSFMERYLPTLSDRGMQDLIAHSTFTFLPVQNLDATLVLVWAKKSDKEINFSVEMVMDIIYAYNLWGRKLYQEGVLLDTGRMFVRIQRFNIDEGIKAVGPKNMGKLVALGSYNPAENIEEAFRTANVDLRDTIIEIAACNGWCKSNAAVDDYLLHPRNDIFV